VEAASEETVVTADRVGTADGLGRVATELAAASAASVRSHIRGIVTAHTRPKASRALSSLSVAVWNASAGKDVEDTGIIRIVASSSLRLLGRVVAAVQLADVAASEIAHVHVVALHALCGAVTHGARFGTANVEFVPLAIGPSG